MRRALSSRSVSLSRSSGLSRSLLRIPVSSGFVSLFSRFSHSSASSSSSPSTRFSPLSGSGPDHWKNLPQNVGIHAMDIYFPKTFIKQSELEKHYNMAPGKYTIGLGQTGLSYVNDREDIVSIALSSVSSFMAKYNIPYSSIGRLEVGTETIQDHSKSIKSVLMQLFGSNTDIEGVDSMNACYGGTHALFNSLDWIESSAWDGRYALVVCGDIAEYAEGPARPTNGCGMVVMLVGPNAPLVVERGTRATHMEHAYDFYKPNLNSPYPVVDGKFSNSCYLKALDVCYRRYAEKYSRRFGQVYTVSDIDYFLYHAPYNKLVQKAFGRALYNDFKLHPSNPKYESLKQFASLPDEQSYENVALDKALAALSKAEYAKKCSPGTLLPVQVGNMYTGSLYAGLLSLVATQTEKIAGSKVTLFSYGSGLAASMFGIRVGNSAEARNQLKMIQETADIDRRLASRTEKSCQEFTEAMKVREQLHHSNGPFETRGAKDLWPGAYYLVSKDDRGRRVYEKHLA